MSEPDFSCDCGCEDIKRSLSGENITYYAEPEPWQFPDGFWSTPGVTSAWFLLDGEYLPVSIISWGDGRASVTRRDL